MIYDYYTWIFKLIGLNFHLLSLPTIISTLKSMLLLFLSVQSWKMIELIKRFRSYVLHKAKLYLKYGDMNPSKWLNNGLFQHLPLIIANMLLKILSGLLSYNLQEIKHREIKKIKWVRIIRRYLVWNNSNSMIKRRIGIEAVISKLILVIWKRIKIRQESKRL